MDLTPIRLDIKDENCQHAWKVDQVVMLEAKMDIKYLCNNCQSTLESRTDLKLLTTIKDINVATKIKGKCVTTKNPKNCKKKCKKPIDKKDKPC